MYTRKVSKVVLPAKDTGIVMAEGEEMDTLIAEDIILKEKKVDMLMAMVMENQLKLKNTDMAMVMENQLKLKNMDMVIIMVILLKRLRSCLLNTEVAKQ
jgi:hypothetical protein